MTLRSQCVTDSHVSNSMVPSIYNPCLTMTMVSKFIQEHTGQEWFHILRVPFMFFTILELLLVLTIWFNNQSKVRYMLDGHSALTGWKYTIICVSLIALVGMLTRGVKSLSKYHITSTAQLINSLAWGCAGFILLDSNNETALAFGLFFMSVMNVGLAIIDEGWGERKIQA